MRDDDALLIGWARVVDAIVRGERPRRPLVTLGPTPALLQGLGLAPADLVMSTGEIARARREHASVPLALWRELPRLIGKPAAVIPSSRQDGSLLVVLVVTDAEGNPVLAPIAPGLNGAPNVVLSIYGKESGLDWVNRQIRQAAQDAMPHYVAKGFAATLPQPGSASAIPSLPGLIPADGTTKPRRDILTPGVKSKDERADDVAN